MGGRERRLKKLSATNPDKPHESSIFFVELSLGSTKVCDRLREAGAKIEIHKDHFKEDEDDQVWLREVGVRGWACLMKDERIRYRAVELEALIQGKIPAFVFANGNLSAQTMAEAFAKALPKMKRYVGKYQTPFIAKVYQDGGLTMWLDSVDLPIALENLLRSAQTRQEKHGKGNP